MATESPSPNARKHIALIVSCYNIARYLDDFINSVESQDFDLFRLEIVAVNDGSTDDTLQRLQAWEARRPELVRIVDKVNGGLSSARNAGLDNATATWVTFIDPDDMMGEGYLAAIDAQMRSHPDATLFAANRLYYEEDRGGVINDGHPLRRMWADGDKRVDLDQFPEYFFHHCGAAFHRLDVINTHGLRFDHRIWPIFEDAHFNIRYLLQAGPIVGFVASARYLYRRRSDMTSMLQTSNRHPEKFTDVPRFGYLDALQHALAIRGSVPEWVQNMIIYDLSWHFTNEDRSSGAQSAAVGEVGREFVGLLKEIRGHLDSEVIMGFEARSIKPLHRELMNHALRDGDWHTPYVCVDRYDRRHRQVRIVYRYVGEAPREEILFRGQPTTIVAAKTRALLYFGQVLMRERIAWVPANGTLRVRLNGRPMPLQREIDQPRPISLRPSRLQRLAEGPLPQRRSRSLRKQVQRTAATAFLALADSLPMRTRYRNAWVLMDRITDANDSAELLFRYLRRERPKINAWFVLTKGGPDWTRLVADGYGNRLIEHGSIQWRLLMLNCTRLISSHVDKPILYPPVITALRRPGWKYVFLQHGVIKNDISAWLNPKPISLFVTSSPAEYHSIVDDESPYVFTSKEVKMTGLPRFDRLLEVGALPPREQDYVLLAPTWRKNLEVYGSDGHAVDPSRFRESDFWAAWGALATDPTLAEACARHGKRVALLLHPNLQALLPNIDLPDHVVPLSFEGADVQRIFGRAACTITDYSSMAFNSAYLDRPVVYFQFDEEQVKQGAHLGREGHFDYRRDGFGPVTATVEETVDAVTTVLAAGLDPAYAERIATAFPVRDGQCCARTVAAIEAL